MIKPVIDISYYLQTTAEEAFQILNANMAMNRKNQVIKSIAIVSFEPGEGKTTVAINLARTAAKSGVRALYIDADIRQIGISNRYGGGHISGLTNYRIGTKIDDIIYDTPYKNLKCITVGSKVVDPVEFLSGNTFEDLLRNVTSQFEMVIIDSPCSAVYADGAIIASKVSGVLIVVRPNKTSYRNIERIKWQMENVAANIIGMVVNRVSQADYKSYFNSK